ncbi:multidrug efflux MFS transporter SdrM [Staphylococcus chromogenes]|uniref:multidrug efflux MFS transporter SdrM n=1 Tax=Staphylococcus chromogenes TaxID=46126 RepID=UPI003D7F4093
MKIKQINIIVSLVLIMFMSAIETTIVAIALPTMRKALQPDASIALVFTIYFVGIVTAIPVISEMMSRIKVRMITLIGLCFFIGGSLLAGLSGNFELLLLARFIQGIGAGVNMSLAQIVPKLAFEIPFRYKVMGIVGSVWGISSIIGPFIGGVILEWTTWHWLFFINVPIGLVAMILVVLSYHFDNETIQKHPVDFKGILGFYFVIALFMLLVSTFKLQWIYLVGIALFLISGWGMIQYFKRQSRPFIALKEFTPTVRLAFFTDLLIAMILIGFNVFIPSYLQDMLNLTPLQSGLVIFPLSVGWLIINFTLDKIEARLSLKMLYISLLSILLLASLSVFFNVMHPIFIAITVFFAGMSFGSAYTKDSVLVQESVSADQMKKMMSLFTLTRNLGNAIGSAIMGTVYGLSIAIFHFPIQHVMLLTLVLIIILILLWIVNARRINTHN